MRLNLVVLSKVYLLSFGLFHLNHVISLLGVNETILGAPSYIAAWWWHFILLLVYGAAPITAALTDNEKICLLVTGASVIWTFVGATGVFVMAMNIHYISVLLSPLASAFSLILAVENVASRISAEILSLEWSQF